MKNNLLRNAMEKARRNSRPLPEKKEEEKIIVQNKITLNQKYPDGKIPDEDLLLVRHKKIINEKVKKMDLQIQLNTRFHYFIDDAEKKQIVKFDDPENKYSCMIYTYIEEPIFSTGYIFDSLYDMFSSDHVEGHDLIMYYIYYDSVAKKYGMKCTKVLNSDEFGSKHFNLMEACPPNHYFVSAGEIKVINNTNIVLFNLMSGTFSRLTIDNLAYAFQLDEYDGEYNQIFSDIDKVLPDDFVEYSTIFSDVEDTIPNKYKILKKNFTKFYDVKEFEQYTMEHLKNLNPYYRFVFVDETLVLDIEQPFVNYKLNIENNVSPYYILVDEEYGKYMQFIFNFATSILFVFRHLDKMHAYEAEINCRVSEYDESKTAQTSVGITMEEIQNTNNVSKSDSRRRMIIFPQINDLNIAKSIFKKYRMSDFNSNPTVDVEPPQTKLFDILEIENKSYIIERYGIKSHVLHIDNVTFMGNSLVYNGRMNEKRVVVKFLPSYYKFMDNYINIQNARIRFPISFADEEFYGTEIYNFILPGTAFECSVIPYLGESVEKLDFVRRPALYEKFKVQYIKAFIKHGIGIISRYGNEIIIKYKDVKPENVTIDENEDFHLIDRDDRGHSFWYGPGTDNIKSVLFSIAALFYWFKTNIVPYDNTDIAKIKWANDIQDTEIKEMLRRISDFDITSIDKKKLGISIKHIYHHK